MVKTRAVQVRLTRDQHERIKQNTQLRGFPSLAAYLRYVALDHEFVIHGKICDIHRFLLGEPPTKQRRKTVKRTGVTKCRNRS